MAIDYYAHMQDGINRAFLPLNRFVETKSQLALADLARRQKREDDEARTASEMALMSQRARLQEEATDKEMEKRAKLAREEMRERRKEEEEKERRALYFELRRAGVPNVSIDDSIQTLNAKGVEHSSAKADSVLVDVYGEQLAENERAQKLAMEEMRADLFSTGTPEIRSQALKQLLYDPTSNVLSDKQKRDIMAIADQGGDPDKMVQKVVKQLGDYWFPWRADEASERVQSFMGTYLSLIEAKVGDSKKSLAQTHAMRLRQLAEEGAALRKDMNRYAAENGTFITDAGREKLNAKLGIGKKLPDANAEMAKILQSTPNTNPVINQPQQENAEPEPRANSVPPVSRLAAIGADLRDQSGSRMAEVMNNTPSWSSYGQKPGDVGLVLNDWDTSGDYARAQPIAAEQAMQNRLKVDQQMVEQIAADPNLSVAQFTEDELPQVQAIAAAKYGGTPDSWSKTLAAVRRGRPVDEDSKRRIAAFNFVLSQKRKMYRGAPVQSSASTMVSPTP